MAHRFGFCVRSDYVPAARRSDLTLGECVADQESRLRPLGSHGRTLILQVTGSGPDRV